MQPRTNSTVPNVQQAVPLFMVANIEASLRFYVEGLGFTIKNRWEPEGKLRWCWLQLGNAAIMLQEYGSNHPLAQSAGNLGEGVSVCFQCKDALALYREFTARSLAPQEPFVGNHMWIVILSDPDGYKLDFESPTDAPEETTLSEWEG